MARPRSPTGDYFIYLVVRLLVCVVQAVSLETGQTIAQGIAWLAYRFDRRHREVALDNLRQAFPGQYSERRLHRLARRVYRHFASVVIEMMHLPRKLHPPNWRQYIPLEDGRAVACLLSERPLLIISGHFGNWEMSGYLMGLIGFKTFAVARPLDNPYLDRFLRRFRQHTGQTILAKKGELDRMEGILAGGGTIAMLADQDAGSKGMFVDFFGRPASTHKAIALLAVQHRAILLVGGAQKIGEPMKYVQRVADIIYPEDYESHPDALRYVTQRYTTALESLVRRDPTQYLWLHRRWKSKPGVRRRRKKPPSPPVPNALPPLPLAGDDRQPVGVEA